MKKFLIPATAILVLIVLLLGGGVWWNSNKGAVSSDETQKEFLIVRGRSASQVGQKLYEEGLIKSTLAFKAYVQLTGKSKKINAGEFNLSPSMSLVEIVEQLGKGPEELWVTIPEGLRAEEVVERIVGSLEMEPEQATSFRKEFLGNTQGDEGYLFPDTYLFPRDVTASQVVNTLKNTFDTKTEILSDGVQKSGYTLNQLITLASIIERETITDEERAVVAGILLKRLEAGWPLQADASVQYAVGTINCKLASVDCEWWPILTRDDLEINSPYNSYKFEGLPPGPIANPGFSSIEAAVKPKSSEYWFYIHDPSGKIHYAETVAGHNQNVRQYLGK